jgi:DNA polymerase-3 subunit alpha
MSEKVVDSHQELAHKVLGILRKKGISQESEVRVQSEIDRMLALGVLEDVFVLYQKVEKTPSLRGSENTVNSLVAYLLGVTSKAPDGEFQLEKRRTYGRSGFPDIDMDFDYARRNEIESYLREKYGEGYVGQIGTVQTLKTKAAVRRVIKVLDPDKSIVFNKDGKVASNNQSENFALQNEVLRSIPNLMKRPDGSLIRTVKEAYEEYDEFRAKMNEYPEVYRIAQRMEGGISAFGCHAAGVVISPEPLKYICPLHVTHGVDDEEKKGEKTIATQFNMSEVESLGLIKFDVLGLSTLTAISLACRWIKENEGIDIDVANLPLADEDTLRLLTTGETDGCFQLENYGMKETLRQIGIDSFDDLVVAIAMYRPGPKDYIPQFAKRKRNPASVRYVHPIVERYTKKTHGIIVYQEQAMQIFVDLADLTPSEGYVFIKGAAKKKPELFQSMRKSFIDGASRKSNREVAEIVWKQMEPFQGYAFNKSHACSYAYASWTTAYLKAHYRTEFMAARLTVEAQRRRFDDVDKYEKDAQAAGIAILPPDLNRSKLHYSIVGEKELLRPLIIKGVGDKAAEDIIDNQPYYGSDLVFEFASKVGRTVNSKVVEALCDAKLFGKMRKSKVLEAFETIKQDRARSKGKQVGDIFS